VISESGPERSPLEPEHESPHRRVESDERASDGSGEAPRDRAGSPPAGFDPSDDELPPHKVIQLNQTHGNAFVQRLVQRRDRIEHVEQSADVAAGRVRPENDWPKIAGDATAAAEAAVTRWKATATMTGIVVNAVTAAGGILIGPPLQPLIMQNMVGAGVKPNIAMAFATAVNAVWITWSSSVKVPGLPWYPSFAAFPGPVAPPTPNVPVPLVALAGVPITPPMVRATLTATLAAIDEPGKDEAIAQFANQFATSFQTMLVTTMVTNVLGTGAVPTFAPPYVPVGPVIGTAMAPPGFLVGGAIASPAAATSPNGKRAESSAGGSGSGSRE
jgi:hypothetical protein